MKIPAAEEEENKKVVRRSVVARVDIPEGTIISEEMLDIRRPSGGIEPKYIGMIAGRKAKDDIKSGELVTFAKMV